jgi:hypothetical protein
MKITRNDGSFRGIKWIFSRFGKVLIATNQGDMETSLNAHDSCARRGNCQWIFLQVELLALAVLVPES